VPYIAIGLAKLCVLARQRDCLREKRVGN
jgi:hypothetical protein